MRQKSLACAENPSKIPPSSTHSLISTPAKLTYFAAAKTASMLNKHHKKVINVEVEVGL